jgi:hypothetical protein
MHWGFNTPANLYGGVRFGGAHESVPETFRLTDRISVPGGHYTNSYVRAAGGTPFDKRLRAHVNLESGTLFGGRRMTATVEPTWSQSRHLEVSAVLSATRLDFPGVDPVVERLIRSRVRVAITSQLFVESLVQVNSVRGATTSNLRLRYNPAEGHDLWVAFDQQNGSSIATGSPNSRALIAKYSRMFTVDLGKT